MASPFKMLRTKQPTDPYTKIDHSTPPFLGSLARIAIRISCEDFLAPVTRCAWGKTNPTSDLRLVGDGASDSELKLGHDGRCIRNVANGRAIQSLRPDGPSSPAWRPLQIRIDDFMP
jgi:hypothetical protein